MSASIRIGGYCSWWHCFRFGRLEQTSGSLKPRSNGPAAVAELRFWLPGLSPSPGLCALTLDSDEYISETIARRFWVAYCRMASWSGKSGISALSGGDCVAMTLLDCGRLVWKRRSKVKNRVTVGQAARTFLGNGNRCALCT